MIAKASSTRQLALMKVEASAIILYHFYEANETFLSPGLWQRYQVSASQSATANQTIPSAKDRSFKAWKANWAGIGSSARQAIILGILQPRGPPP
ncbi:hypothetical protein O181_021880 [Austropuccinia psidii MF-1]|uniref:Uncharacterized protein n=1 Tax=Austropuccinia psidii MF-1 TaxID=1389203 RepID=A0A9Q3CFE7_9BASI|nr:hypothetical protein [Austropuccinia psidii MF-1]